MKKQKDSLGDRMKMYEAVPKVFLTLGIPMRPDRGRCDGIYPV